MCGNFQIKLDVIVCELVMWQHLLRMWLLEDSKPGLVLLGDCHLPEMGLPDGFVLALCCFKRL